MKLYDTIPHYALKFLRRKVYPRLFTPYELPMLKCEDNLDASNQMIYELLSGDKPCMIARFGANEMSVISNYLHIKKGSRNVWKYIQGYNGEWWWNDRTLEQMKSNAGFWPVSHEAAIKFVELSIADSHLIDILGSWLHGEYLLKDDLTSAKKVSLFALEPFFSTCPWTRVLKGKRVLIVHPFADTIEKQYNKRELLFSNPDILPHFDLLAYKSVQSMGGNNEYMDWFDALRKMESDIDDINFDIAIIGCGAYGLSLAAHIKRNGKKAVHLGGVTQVLFGIKGNRWEHPVESMCKYGYYPDLMNEYWVKPAESEKPKTANEVEGACYW